jgi:hypothetical protein
MTRKLRSLALTVGFLGSLGAAHARTVMRVLLAVVCRRVGRVGLVSKRDRVEHTAAYDRQLGYDELVLRFEPPVPA